jgi:hypothetical protein
MHTFINGAHEIVVLEQLLEEHVAVGAENKLVAVSHKPVDRARASDVRASSDSSPPAA